MAERRALSQRHLETMRAGVVELARVLSASGAPPERALILVKDAVQALVTEAPMERERVMDQVVRWFVESYYAA